MDIYDPVLKLAQQLAEARETQRKERQAKAWDAATARINELMTQQYWKSSYEHIIPNYHNCKTVTLMSMRKLKLSWSAPLRSDGQGGAYANADEATLNVEGEVCILQLPVLPTLIVKKGCEPDKMASGHGLLSPPVACLKVRRQTRTEAKAGLHGFISYAPGTLPLPVTISAAPKLGFREPLSFFADLVKSSETEFTMGIRLIHDFVVAAQQAFPA